MMIKLRVFLQEHVQKVFQKQESMEEMFQKRQVSLKKLAAKQMRPVQPVAPRPEVFVKSQCTSPGKKVKWTYKLSLSNSKWNNSTCEFGCKCELRHIPVSAVVFYSICQAFKENLKTHLAQKIAWSGEGTTEEPRCGVNYYCSYFLDLFCS